jgi:uncharacterized membrane protein
MSEQERLDRLERRVASLEHLMRRMMAGGASAPAEIEEPPVAAAPSASPPPEPPRVETPRPRAEPLVAPRPSLAAAKDLSARSFDGEQWVGQRGLLAVGVVAVVLAAGYLLKLSFDRGWVSPLVRCLSGGVTGILIYAAGGMIDRRGYRTYGPALMGLGAAIIYTVIWAACVWYQFIGQTPAVIAMAAVSLLLAASAWMVDRQWLGATAAVGVFLAPIAIGSVDPDPERLMLYLATMGSVLGWVAWMKEWRIAMFIVALSYFGVGAVAADLGWNPAVLAYGAIGGAAGMSVGLWKRWWETRFFAYWGGWGIVAMGASTELAPWVLLAGVALAWPVWDHALRADATWPFAGESSERNVLPSFYFYLTPLWLGWAVGMLDLAVIQQYPGATAALVALTYLAIGVQGERRSFALVAVLGSWWAVAEQWNGDAPAAGVLGILAVLYGTLSRSTRRRDWDVHALLTLLIALVIHWTTSLDGRPSGTPAFFDPWALVLWGLLVVTVAFASTLRAPEGNAAFAGSIGFIWGVAGIELLAGVTWELTRLFDLRAIAGVGSSLAAGLAVSAWWLVYAGIAVWLGFRLRQKSVRVAGLLVSGMAVVKVLFFDLSKLDALYRIGSVFLLGLVSLAVAWTYNRRARTEVQGPG